MNVASFIEHSFLRSTTTIADIENICKEAIENQFAAVCVPPIYVKRAKGIVQGANIQVATSIGFPMGYSAIEAKLAESVLAIVDGADELNLMINLVALKNADWQYLAKEINSIIPIVRKSGKVLKVIIEAGLLSNEELVTCCDIYGAAGVDFIQVSSGFEEQLPSLETLKLVRKHLADAIGIKAGDGNCNIPLADLVEAGATRIVCKYPVQAINDLKNS